LANTVQHKGWVVIAQDRAFTFRVSSRPGLRHFCRHRNQMTNGLAPGNTDGSAKALRPFTKRRGYWRDSWTAHRKQAVLVDGRCNGADVRISSQDRDQMGPGTSLSLDLADEAIQSKPDVRRGVLHSLCVFQDPEPFVRVSHGLSPNSTARLLNASIAAA
jgi:hypothetical protein